MRAFSRRMEYTRSSFPLSPAWKEGLLVAFPYLSVAGSVDSQRSDCTGCFCHIFARVTLYVLELCLETPGACLDLTFFSRLPAGLPWSLVKIPAWIIPFFTPVRLMILIAYGFSFNFLLDAPEVFLLLVVAVSCS